MARQQVTEVRVNVEGEHTRFDARKGAPQGKLRGLLGLAAATIARSDRAIEQRRAIPIHAYVGENGGGKTATMLLDTLPSLAAGRTVLSTFPIYEDKANGVLHPSYVPFRSWHQLLDMQHADVLMDEVTGVASSQDSTSMHATIQNRLVQLRKADLVIRWSAPAWPRAAKVLREVSWAVTECSGWMRDRTAVGALWTPRRLFRAVTYDVREFDEWSAGKRDKATKLAKQWWIGPGSRVFESYATLDAVERLEPYDPNACPDCGLPKRREYCGGRHERPLSVRERRDVIEARASERGLDTSGIVWPIDAAPVE